MQPEIVPPFRTSALSVPLTSKLPSITTPGSTHADPDQYFVLANAVLEIVTVSPMTLVDDPVAVVIALLAVASDHADPVE